MRRLSLSSPGGLALLRTEATFSRSLRSSGWKMTMRAITATWLTFWKIHSMPSRLSSRATANTAKALRMPRTIFQVPRRTSVR